MQFGVQHLQFSDDVDGNDPRWVVISGPGSPEAQCGPVRCPLEDILESTHKGPVKKEVTDWVMREADVSRNGTLSVLAKVKDGRWEVDGGSLS